MPSGSGSRNASNSRSRWAATPRTRGTGKRLQVKAHRSAQRAGAVRLAILALTLVCASLSGSPSLSAEPRSETAYAWRLPAGFPPPPVPEDNAMSSAKVELGRHLFYDPRLSGPGTIACDI